MKRYTFGRNHGAVKERENREGKDEGNGVHGMGRHGAGRLQKGKRERSTWGRK